MQHVFSVDIQLITRYMVVGISSRLANKELGGEGRVLEDIV